MEIDKSKIQKIVAEVVEQFIASRNIPAENLFDSVGRKSGQDRDAFSQNAERAAPLTLEAMKARTTARIGVGRAGARMKTATLLALRADHAIARDAAFLDVSPALLKELNLAALQTKCKDKNEFLTRPDLGRQFDEDAIRWMRGECIRNPDVQIIIADGLSSKAIEANARKILPMLTEGLREKNVSVGTPFFIKYGRVPSMDVVSETVGARVTCILIGERPGLANPESMSAYICYNARVGIPESKRTVVSNIHRNGISAVEAGAYIVDLVYEMLRRKASGVDFQR